MHGSSSHGGQDHHFLSRSNVFRISAAAALFSVFAISPAQAGFSAKDIQVLGRVLGFLEQAPPSTVSVGLVYDSPASQKQAEALMGQVSGKIGNFTLVPKLVKSSDLAGAGVNAVLLMDGVGGSAAADAAKSKKIPCFTGDTSLVRSGSCLISVKTDPKVEILVNSGLSKSSGISFGAAFRMMITEI